MKAPGRRRVAAFGTRRLEKDVEAEIIRDLRTIGVEVYKLSQPRATKQTAGLLDLYIRHVGWGIAGWLEVKRDHSQHASFEQSLFIQRELALGRFVALVTCSAEAMAALRDAGAPIRL